MFTQPNTPIARGPQPNRRSVTWMAIVLALSVQACEEDKAPTAPADVGPQSVASTAGSQASATVQIAYNPDGLRFEMEAPLIESRLVPHY